MGARSATRARTQRSRFALAFNFPLPPLCTPATQATVNMKNIVLRDICVTFYDRFSLILLLRSNMISLIDIPFSVVLCRNPVSVSFHTCR